MRPHFYRLNADHTVTPVGDGLDWESQEYWVGMEGRGLGGDAWRVARTEVGDVVVSTVFLGIDHGYGDEPLQLFETMTFPGEDQWRYSTWDEAEHGHAQVVDELRSTGDRRTR